MLRNRFLLHLHVIKTTKFNFMSRLFLVILVFFGYAVNAQTIFSIEDKEIAATDFARVYEKNKTSQFSEEILSVEDYLKLYINFHLKVYEAEEQGIPEEEKFKTEFARFYKQLADNHIANGEVTEEMIQEVYHRLKNEVRVSHILINFPQDKEQPKTEAYKKALSIIEKLEEGENFEDLAEQYSQDPSVKMNKGDMGWFKAFKMVTPFEDEAYALEVGEISMPVETQFGYHIIQKTGERASLGKILVAHIMLYADPKKEEEITKKIKDIYAQLAAGESFEELAKQFSEDTNSAEKGGVMVPFEIGSLNSQKFEEVAFSLSENGEFSEPFQTRFGWHIVKRLDTEPVAPYEELKSFLSKKIKTSDRAKLLNNRIQDKLSEYHEVEVNEEAIIHFEKTTDGLIQKSKWEYKSNKEDAEKIAFKIDDQKFTWEDLGNYLHKNQRGIELSKPSKSVVRDLTNTYLYGELVEAHKKILTEIDPVFKSTVNEYRDGLLLYEIMEREVWDKAKNDSIGIEQWYKNHLNLYYSDNEVEVEIIRASSKKEAKKIKKAKAKGIPNNELNEQFQEAIFSSKEWKKSNSSRLPKNLDDKTNKTTIYLHNGQHLVITVYNKKPSALLPLEDIRGRVISDYQEALEEKWVNQLSEKYNIKINDAVVNEMKKTLE